MRWIVLVLLGTITMTHCSTFNPKSSQMSIILVSASLEKDEPIIDEFIQPEFHKVTLKRGDLEFTYSKKSGHYYYFQNLTPGQYELGRIVHYLNIGFGGHHQANKDSTQLIEPSLSSDDQIKTIVNVEPGSVNFLGEIQVKAKIRTKKPIELHASFSKKLGAEKRALNHLIRNYPRSGWADLSKDRLKTLNVISVE